MLEGKRLRHSLCWVLAAWGCSSPRPIDPDIVRSGAGEPFLAALPGPMLGSFDSFEDALLASCRKIIEKPNATAGRKDHQDFWTRWRVSTEYCAWIYYTPDDKYEVSRLTDQSEIDPADRSRNCSLPSVVEDRRYPPDSIKYICSLHNHLFDDTLSRRDIRFIVSQGLRHGFESTTAEGSAHFLSLRSSRIMLKSPHAMASISTFQLPASCSSIPIKKASGVASRRVSSRGRMRRTFPSKRRVFPVLARVRHEKPVPLGYHRSLEFVCGPPVSHPPWMRIHPSRSQTSTIASQSWLARSKVSRMNSME